MRVVVAFFLVLVFLTSADGLVLDKSLHITSFSQPFVEFAQFGFQDEGHYNFTVEYTWGKGYNASVLQLLICDQDQIQQYRRSAPIDECVRPQTLSRCFRYLTLDDPEKVYQVEGKIETGVSYLFLLINCEYSPFDAKIAGYLVNSNGSHTSTETRPLPLLYTSFLGIWVLLAIGMLTNALQFRRFNIPLQRVLVLNAFVKIISLIIQIKYFSDLNSSGYITPVLFYCSWALIFLKNLSKFSVIFLVTKGWCITRAFFQRRELLSLLLVIFLVAGNYSVFQAFGGYFMWPHLFVFMISMRYFFSALHVNTKNLKVQMLLIQDILENQQENFDERHKQIVSQKIKMFKPLQIVLILFVFSQILRLIVNQFIVHHFFWVGTLVEEAFEELSIALVCAFVLRLRDFDAAIGPQTLDPEPSDDVELSDKPKATDGRVLVIQNPGCVSSKNPSIPLVTLAVKDTSYFKTSEESTKSE